MSTAPQRPDAQQLAVLVGDWTTEVVHADVSPDPIPSRQRFEWILDRRFVMQHWTVDHPAFPDATLVLGPDACHYFDDRGVARVYAMSLRDGVWRLERRDADFWQRFTGVLHPDGTRIDGTWEASHDRGATWVHDLTMTFTRTR